VMPHVHLARAVSRAQRAGKSKRWQSIDGMGDGGLEPLAGNAEKTGQFPNSGAKSDAVGPPVPLPDSQSQGRAWDRSISRLSEAHQRLVWELVCALLAAKNHWASMAASEAASALDRAAERGSFATE